MRIYLYIRGSIGQISAPLPHALHPPPVNPESTTHIDCIGVSLSSHRRSFNPKRSKDKCHKHNILLLLPFSAPLLNSRIYAQSQNDQSIY